MHKIINTNTKRRVKMTVGCTSRVKNGDITVNNVNVVVQRERAFEK